MRVSATCHCMVRDLLVQACMQCAIRGPHVHACSVQDVDCTCMQCTRRGLYMHAVYKTWTTHTCSVQHVDHLCVQCTTCGPHMHAVYRMLTTRTHTCRYTMWIPGMHIRSHSVRDKLAFCDIRLICECLLDLVP